MTGKSMHTLRAILLFALLLVLSVGCSAETKQVIATNPPSTATVTSAPPTTTPIPATPTPIPTVTIIPSPTVTSTPMATPLPFSSKSVSQDNAGQVQLLSAWGRGQIRNQLETTDQKSNLVISKTGFYLYALPAYKLLLQVNGADRYWLSPSQKWFVINSYQGQPALIETATGRIQRTFEVPGEMHAVAFNADESKVLLSHGDAVVDLWPITEGKAEQTFTHTRTESIYQQEYVDQLAISPDGSLLVTHEVRGHMLFWSVADGKLLNVIKYLNENLSVIPFTPDGKRVILTSKAKVIIRAVKTGELVFEMPGALNKNGISPDGKLIVLVQEQLARVYSLGEFPAPLRFIETGLMVRSTDFSADSKTLSINGGAKAYQMADWTEVKVTPVAITAQNIDSSRAVQLMHLASTGISVDAQRKIYAWQIDGQTVFVTDVLNGGSQSVKLQGYKTNSNIVFDGGSQTLAVCTDAGFEIISLKTRESKTLGGCFPSTFLVLSSDGKILARSAQTGIEMLNWPGGDVRGRFLEHSKTVTKIAFSSDGSRMVSGTDKMGVMYSEISLWQLDPAQSLKFQGKQTQDTVRGIAVSPGGEYIIAATDKLRLWRASDSTQLQVIDTRPVVITLSPDGKVLAAGESNGQVTLYSVPDLKFLAAISAHKETVTQVLFTADGANLVSLSRDGTVALLGIK